MQKFIVLLLLLDLFSVTLQKSDRKEVTIPVGSPIQLECDDDLKVNNIEVTIRRSNTTCFGSIPECILPNDAIENIKATCTKQVSCDVDIRNITKKHSCLQEYGYFNISYSCKMINDLSCDFESNLCNWLPVHDRNRFQWTRGSRKYLPATVDHTTTSRSGSYVYIYSNYYTSDEGDIAKLESGHIIAHQQCFSFWYFTTNSRDSVHVFQNQNVLLDLSTDKYDKGKWHHIKISLEKTSFYSFQLVFKVKRGISNYWRPFGAIVIDDILIENTMCNSHFFMCDFESNTCGWNDDDANKDIWKKQNGEVAYPNTSPRTDHTTASDSGYYLYLKSRASVVTTSYFIFQNLDLKLPGNSCLTFWYHMCVYNAYRKEGIHVTIDDKIVWTIVGNQDNKWIKAAIDLDVRKLSIIKFIGFLRRNWGNHVALDDISLTVGTCEGLINHYEICKDLDDDMSQEIYCPKGYIDLTNYRLSFEAGKNECSDQYEKTRMRLFQEWKGGVDSQTFLFNMSTDISSKPECFQLHAFRIQHTCKAEEYTTVSQVVTSRDSGAVEHSTTYTVSPVLISIRDAGIVILKTMNNTAGNLHMQNNWFCNENCERIFRLCFSGVIITASKAEESNTVSPVVTSIRDSGAAEESTTVSSIATSIKDSVTVKGVPLPTSVKDSSDSDIGLMAGLVVAGLLLICLVILIVYLVIRLINRRGSNETVKNELRGNDYIGCQDIALPQTAGRSDNMQNIGMYGQRSSSKTTTNTEINNVQHTGSNLGTHKEFQSPPYVACRDDTFTDNQMSNIDEYAMVGPIGETSFSKTGTSDSVLLLEPTVTGLNRTQLSKTSTGYEFAKPVLEAENKTDDEDQYALSEEGVYDHSGNNRHKGLDDNIYNHAVDNIYDSGSHKRNDEGKEDTYDHFFAQKTEDDYDITTTT